jgi:hypothetical protein
VPSDKCAGIQMIAATGVRPGTLGTLARKPSRSSAALRVGAAVTIARPSSPSSPGPYSTVDEHGPADQAGLMRTSSLPPDLLRGSFDFHSCCKAAATAMTPRARCRYRRLPGRRHESAGRPVEGGAGRQR